MRDEAGYYQGILRSNFESGTFVQSAADNTDYVQDMLDRKESIHIMSMVFLRGISHRSKGLGTTLGKVR